MIRLRTRHILGFLAVWVTFLPPASFGQGTASHAPPNTPNIKRIDGTVARVDGNELLLRVKGGTTETYQLAPSIHLLLGRPGLMSDLASGKSVGCTSIFSQGTQALAGECRIFAGGAHDMAEGPDTADASSTPTTTGTITDVRDTAQGVGGKGRRLLIQVENPQGRTMMTVSSLTRISIVTVGDASALKPGAKVRGLSQQAVDGTGVIQTLTIMAPIHRR
ncbi:MAG TPA: hypothetical protein VGM97_16095 [Steroidobacteraceae bacterium]